MGGKKITRVNGGFKVVERLHYTKSVLIVCEKLRVVISIRKGLSYPKEIWLKAKTHFPLTGKSSLCNDTKNFFLYEQVFADLLKSASDLHLLHHRQEGISRRHNETNNIWLFAAGWLQNRTRLVFPHTNKGNQISWKFPLRNRFYNGSSIWIQHCVLSTWVAVWTGVYLLA